MDHRGLGLATWLLVATMGCAAPAAPAPGSANRVAALEREVAAMKAQLDELRLYVLPDEHLSDADFERKLQARLAKAAPGERAQLELTARANRKLAGMTEADLATYWLQRFEAEKVDTAWAKPVEQRCMPGLLGRTEPKLITFECRTERCKVVTSSKDVKDPSSAVVEACGLGGLRRNTDAREPLNLGFMMIEQTADASGTLQTTMMLVREGADMVPR